MKKYFLLGCFFSLSVSGFGVYAADASSSGLCQPEESVVFSCPLQNGKIVSFCGAPVASRSGYIEYRYGKVGKVELKYRAVAGENKKIYFFDGAVVRNQIARVPTIFFRNGRYGYFLSIPFSPTLNAYEAPSLFVNIERSDSLDSAIDFSCLEDNGGKGVFTMNLEPLHPALTAVPFASFKLWQSRFKRANSYHINP